MNGLNKTVGHLLSVGLIAGACGGQALARSGGSEILDRETVVAAMKRAADAFYQFNEYGTYISEYDDERGKRFGPHAKWKFPQDEFLVEPPGTPTVGEYFVNAYKVTRDGEYLQRAIETARILAWRQNNRGGWFRHETVTNYDPDWEYPRRPLGRMVLDDNVTQGTLTFLIRLDEVYDADWLTEAIALGLNGMLTAQHSSGGWPQEWPTHPQRPYSAFMTFNDGTINDCISVMFLAYDTYGDSRYRDAALRGADYIMRSQLPEPQPGWAQQYDLQGRPAAARSHEPAAVGSSVTGRNIETLIDVAVRTGDAKYLAPVGPAMRWLQRSNIGPNTWARLYEIGSNRAIYGGSNGRVYYRLQDIPKQHRVSYNWEGSMGIPRALTTAQDVQRLGIRRYTAELQAELTDGRRESMMKRLSRLSHEGIDGMCDYGLWRANSGRVRTTLFLQNFGYMTRLVELMGPAPEPELVEEPEQTPLRKGTLVSESPRIVRSMRP